MRGLMHRLPGMSITILIPVSGAFVFFVAGMIFSPLIATVVFLGLVSGALIIVFAPRIAYLAMAFVIPIERLGRFGGDLSLETFSLMRLVGLLALAAVIVQMYLRRERVELPRPLVLYGLLIVMAFASISYAFEPVSTKGHAITMLGNYLMLFVLVQGVRDWKTVEWMVLAWLASTLLICLYQIYTWHFQSAIQGADIGTTSTRLSTTWNDLSEISTLGQSRRALGTTSAAAVYGINLLLAVPFIFFFIRVTKSLAGRVFWILAVNVVLYNIVLTNTRSVMAFCVILLVLIAATGLLRITFATVSVTVLAGIVALPLLPASIWHRVLSSESYNLSNATNLLWRFDLWKAAIRLGSENWLTGIGVGNRTELIKYLDRTRFDGFWIMAHNEFLQTFTELGVFGLMLFLLFVGSLLFRAMVTARRFRVQGFETRRYFAVAAGLSIFIGIVFALQVDGFHFPLKGWWLAAGLLLVVERLGKMPRHGLATSKSSPPYSQALTT